MATRYDLDAEHVAFITGSGKDTNKVQQIVADAAELRDEEAVSHAEGAFEGATRTTEEPETSDDPEDGSSADGTAAESTDVDEEGSRNEDPDDDAAADNSQSGLADFY